MNVVAMRSVTPDSRTLPAIDGRIARVDIFDDMAAAEPHWRALERANNLATPYQSYDFLKFWQRHVGAESGVSPFIVVAFNATGTPLFLWPFGTRKLGGLRVVEFLGGKHANFNMALWRRDAAAKIGADDLRAVLSSIAERADIVKLINQPLTWAGTTNPFALLPQQRSANFGFSGALVPDFEALFRARTNAAARKKMRKKERTLASYGAVRFERASGAHDVRRVLDAFFKQKSARMRALGVPDVFTAPGVRRFIEAAATEQIPDRRPADRALRALGRRHHRGDHGRHCRWRAFLRHVQFDRARPLRDRKPRRAIDRQSGARLLRARARHFRSWNRRSALQKFVLRRCRAAVR